MTLKELQEWIEANMEIGIDLENAAREVPRLHGQAIVKRANEVALLRAFEVELDVRKRERWVYYSGKADAKVYKDEPFELKVLKGDLDIFLDSDKKVSEIRSKISLQKLKVELLDEYIKQLNGRSFLISNIINDRKFKNGLA